MYVQPEACFTTALLPCRTSSHLSGPSVCAQALLALPLRRAARMLVCESQPTAAHRLYNGSHSSVAATGLPSPAAERHQRCPLHWLSLPSWCSHLREHVTLWRLHLSRNASFVRLMGHLHSSTGPKSCNYESACIVEVLDSPYEAAGWLSRVSTPPLCSHMCAALAPLHAKHVAASNPAASSPGDPGSTFLIYLRSASVQPFALDEHNACSFTASPAT
jgi:hypothetical protein